MEGCKDYTPEPLRGFTPLSTRFALREGDDSLAAGRPLRGVPELECASFKRCEAAPATIHEYQFPLYAALSLPYPFAHRHRA